MTKYYKDVLLERVWQPDGAVLHRVGVRLPEEQVPHLPSPSSFEKCPAKERFLPFTASFVCLAQFLYTGLVSSGYCSVVGNGFEQAWSYVSELSFSPKILLL